MIEDFNPWVILILGFFVFDILVIVFVLFLRRGKKFKPEELNYIKSHWIRIIDMFNTSPKMAILDLDKLLDYALSRKGFYEGTLGDKLKKAGSRFSDLDGVWFAHKLRNDVVHEFGEVNIVSAKKALSCFKKALNDLGANL